MRQSFPHGEGAGAEKERQRQRGETGGGVADVYGVRDPLSNTPTQNKLKT